MAMNEVDQDRVRADEIFFAAIDIESDAERTAYVEQACGDDGQLRAKVERLLSAVAESETFFSADAPTHITTAEVAETLDGIGGILEQAGRVFEDDEEVGKQIGPYKLLRKIGEGGSGNVYMAEQSAPVQRLVAFKIIKRGMDTKSVIARFEAERQTLAMMEHPNIAHVYDAGETETGRPYFVMELVHGIPITALLQREPVGYPPAPRTVHPGLLCHPARASKGHHPSRHQALQCIGRPARRPCRVPEVIDFGIAKAIRKGIR